MRSKTRPKFGKASLSKRSIFRYQGQHILEGVTKLEIKGFFLFLKKHYLVITFDYFLRKWIYYFLDLTPDDYNLQ